MSNDIETSLKEAGLEIKACDMSKKELARTLMEYFALVVLAGKNESGSWVNG